MSCEVGTVAFGIVALIVRLIGIPSMRFRRLRARHGVAPFRLDHRVTVFIGYEPAHLPTSVAVDGRAGLLATSSSGRAIQAAPVIVVPNAPSSLTGGPSQGQGRVSAIESHSFNSMSSVKQPPSIKSFTTDKRFLMQEVCHRISRSPMHLSQDHQESLGRRVLHEFLSWGHP